MKKRIAVLSIGLAATCGYAENRLFPTDVLQQGEFDMRLSAEHQTISSSIHLPTNDGKQSLDLTAETFQVRYGVGNKWHFGVSLPYFSEDVTRTDWNSPSFHFESRLLEGWQNPSVWLTYGVINDPERAFSLNGEVLASIKTTDQSAYYSARLTAAWKSSNTLKLYSSLSVTEAANFNSSSTNSLVIGAFAEVSEYLTVVPHANYSFASATNSYSSQYQEGMGLSANIKVAQNTYLVPDVSIHRESGNHSKDGLFHRDATSNGKLVGISLYGLF